MTAINVVFAKDRAHLLVDGAGYTNEGMPLAFTQKAVAMPALGAAMAVQGTVFAPVFLAQAWSATFIDFDHFVQNVADYLYADYQVLCDQHGGHEKIRPFRVMVAGWSADEDRPMGFVFDNTNEKEMFAFLDDEPGDWAMMPTLSAEEEQNLAAINVMRDCDFVGRFDPVRHGIPVMEAQRRMPIIPLESKAGAERSIVGGYILSTEITATEITQKVIHRWHDDVGRIITPDAFVAPRNITPLAPAGMNRQQRKRFEAQKRKGAA